MSFGVGSKVMRLSESGLRNCEPNPMRETSRSLSGDMGRGSETFNRSQALRMILLDGERDTMLVEICDGPERDCPPSCNALYANR